MTTKENKGDLSLALEVMDQQPVRSPMTPVAQPQTAAGTPLALLQYAMANGGANLDQLERLMAMQRAYEADEARKAYVDAMAEFKKNPPEVVKDKLVGYKNKDGTVTGYTHATLGAVTGAIVAALAQHGFSHRWDTKQDGNSITVTCIITHKLGHSETTSLTSGKDDSGKKNAIQQVASAITYLQRYTLLAATGVATKDQQDDDGAGYSVDTALADEWIAKLEDCTDDAAVVALWAPAVQAFAKDKLGLKEFEEAFVARRAVLQGGAV